MGVSQSSVKNDRGPRENTENLRMLAVALVAQPQMRDNVCARRHPVALGGIESRESIAWRGFAGTSAACGAATVSLCAESPPAID
ncbi:hypothetical protein [Burkholderia multivorans]|uniref:hypothetical protein n=1 Tax=Burkholderia multivorans TaxID=87883 RepID=UPI001E526023|nr:hypothetical protein [Burkholderia multivorans]